MIDSFPPGWLLIFGGLLVPLFRGRVRSAYMLLLPALGFIQLLLMPEGELLQVSIFDYSLTPVRVDPLSLVFGYIFHIAAFLGMIFALRVKDSGQHVAAFVYAGSAIGAVFAGDLITLFVYWEIAAISSVFLIWARRSERSHRAGMRYLIFQIASGVLLLAGTLAHFYQTGSLAFDYLGISSLGGMLILIAFGIKCAFPLLHNWLEDAYPEATVTGTVFLSSFTTKMAVYALARGFPGTEQLIWIGAMMAAFPIFYAVIVNDLRRVLTYSMNNQLGFMVVGVGIGTELALNGAAAHAFADILFKGVLFMSMGAVLLRTGTVKGSELGGLYKSMPWTATFCIVGAASISAFPLFSAFATKSMILSATAENHYAFVYFVLLFASAGVFHHSGIKIPYFAFFGHDSGIRCKEAPRNMLIAMGLAASLCIGIGVFPGVLYNVLPFPVDYEPYTVTHVITQLQLLFWSAVAFAWLNWVGLYPPELRSVNLDSDWVFRRLVPRMFGPVTRALAGGWATMLDQLGRRVTATLQTVHRHHGPHGILERTWPTGSMALWVAILLALILLLYYR
ncbi:MAG TPA: Na(+)/H(+) antiporter subunit D [Acidobacteriota bacterium]|nr:Na(+)/H(+) antiporter subunit D [Acidobacteriota bacterium]HJO28885.1 Na(+)/H(+) antiporter subunit D [Acidobacteriota bacterium]|tara:strand:- start:913 stop:2604 length:1692 start_codon:yes stop_codon:yes gene_type:complete